MYVNQSHLLFPNRDSVDSQIVVFLHTVHDENEFCSTRDRAPTHFAVYEIERHFQRPDGQLDESLCTWVMLTVDLNNTKMNICVAHSRLVQNKANCQVQIFALTFLVHIRHVRPFHEANPIEHQPRSDEISSRAWKPETRKQQTFLTACMTNFA